MKIVALLSNVLIAAPKEAWVCYPPENFLEWGDKMIADGWYLEHGLDRSDPLVLGRDPDGDGFSNRDEWREKTDPRQRESHPPYCTKLFLKRHVQVPCRINFSAYNGDPKKDTGKELTFTLNTIDIRQPSLYLRLGELVPKTKLKLTEFRYKTAFNPRVGEHGDASELVLTDTETGFRVLLELNKVTDYPYHFADFVYLWENPPREFRVSMRNQFRLQPEVGQTYTLAEVNEQEALIIRPSGEKYTVRKVPAELIELSRVRQ